MEISLIALAAFLAVLHSVANPSHYLPFVALGKSNAWGLVRSSLAAAFCGLGHIVGLFFFSLLGIILGEGVKYGANLGELGEHWGSWMFLFFGICYCVYGLWFALNFKGEDSGCSCGVCNACASNLVGVKNPMRAKSFWILFLIFCVSPCDALVPLIFYPATGGDVFYLVMVCITFYVCTILTMALVTAAIYRGISKVKFKSNFLEKWAQLLTGLAIVFSSIFLFFEH